MRKDQGIVGDDRLKRVTEEPGREPLGSDVDDIYGGDGSMLSQAERVRLIRDEFVQEALPRPPELTGFHTCWLSTTNSNDPIPKRLRMGYRPVRFEEVPGFDITYKMNAGQYEGCVACNEMILFKISEERYQDIMATFHHVLPLEEEDKIKNQAMAQEESAAGTVRVERDTDDTGFKSLAERPRKIPVF